MDNRKLEFIDLFAGIGGIRLGLEQSLSELNIDHKCVFSSEIDIKSQETYKMNFSESIAGDIRDVNELPEHDLLLAGFPCQAFSYAGKKKGFVDTRGTLFFEIERLLKNLKNKPEYLFLENVRGFTSHDGGRTCQTVINSLEALGYKTKILILNSSSFNVPQNRVRVYIICRLNSDIEINLDSDLGSADSHSFKNDCQQKSLFENFNGPLIKVKDILESSVPIKYHCSSKFKEQLSKAIDNKRFEYLHGFRMIDYRGGNSLHSWDLGIRGECSEKEKLFMKNLIENRRKKKFGEFQDGKKLSLNQIKTFWKEKDVEETIASVIVKGYLKEDNGKFNPIAGNMSFEVFKFLDPESISITIVSSDANRLGIVDKGMPRRITPRECARLQGFPDNFALHPDDSFSYKQLGNSVSVPVVKAIFNEIYNAA